MIANNNDIIKFLKRITIYVPYSNIVVPSSSYSLYVKNSKMFSTCKVLKKIIAFYVKHATIFPELPDHRLIYSHDKNRILFFLYLIF